VRVFVAEDGIDNQRLVRFHLERAGAEVRMFDNGRTILEALTSDGTVDGPLMPTSPCDVVLTDMQMPELDGYRLAGMLRSKGWTGPIVALTAHAMAGDAERCLAAGCDRYVSKPIHRETLIGACARAAA
jgi:CheY-like chemotaxis protein